MEQQYKKVVEHIFSNWTALQLAVEHCMGGPASKQVALDFVEYITNYCVNEQQNIEAEDIADIMEDVMDQEFNTVCEDDSLKEISNLLYRFLQFLKEGNLAQFEIEYNNLPTGQQQPQSRSRPVQVEMGESNNSELEMIDDADNAQMEQEPGWTQVKTRRKR